MAVVQQLNRVGTSSRDSEISIQRFVLVILCESIITRTTCPSCTFCDSIQLIETICIPQLNLKNMLVRTIGTQIQSYLNLASRCSSNLPRCSTWISIVCITEVMRLTIGNKVNLASTGSVVGLKFITSTREVRFRIGNYRPPTRVAERLAIRSGINSGRGGGESKVSISGIGEERVGIKTSSRSNIVSTMTFCAMIFIPYKTIAYRTTIAIGSTTIRYFGRIREDAIGNRYFRRFSYTNICISGCRSRVVVERTMINCHLNIGSLCCVVIVNLNNTMCQRCKISKRRIFYYHAFTSLFGLRTGSNINSVIAIVNTFAVIENNRINCT